MEKAQTLASMLWRSYVANTDQRLKIIDCFIAYFLLVAAIQAVYCFLFARFPFNSFLAGFLSAVGMFVLTVSLRMQVNPANSKAFGNEGLNKPISKERVYAEWLFCCFILHFAAISYIG